MAIIRDEMKFIGHIQRRGNPKSMGIKSPLYQTGSEERRGPVPVSL